MIINPLPIAENARGVASGHRVIHSRSAPATTVPVLLLVSAELGCAGPGQTVLVMSRGPDRRRAPARRTTRELGSYMTWQGTPSIALSPSSAGQLRQRVAARDFSDCAPVGGYPSITGPLRTSLLATGRVRRGVRVWPSQHSGSADPDRRNGTAIDSVPRGVFNPGQRAVVVGGLADPTAISATGPIGMVSPCLLLAARWLSSWGLLLHIGRLLSLPSARQLLSTTLPDDH